MRTRLFLNFGKNLAILMLSTLAFVGTGCEKKSEAPSEPQSTVSTTSTEAAAAPAAVSASPAAAGTLTQAPDLAVDSSGLSKVTVVLKTSKGNIKFKLYAKDAPNTAKRFSELVQQKFYNGLMFHRVVPGFVVQTGDPKSRNKSDPTIGTGGSGQRLKAEFNSRKHARGSVAMARAADIDSADSQFYITMGPFPHLDEKFTVFGQVVDYGEKVSDKDVLERIAQGDDLIDIHLE
jgi:cyclophilin family peptidyl-prolyl cis-trans isomerase